MRKVSIGLALALVVLGACAFLFMSSVGMFASTPVYSTENGAIDGYDPVAFFTDGDAVRGSEAFSHEWQGTRWRFASEENLEQFRAEPERYAPVYGGYCAFGMASGYTAYTDPRAWSIVDGRLYLNFDADVQEEWQSDAESLIAQADANWPSVRPGAE